MKTSLLTKKQDGRKMNLSYQIHFLNFGVQLSLFSPGFDTGPLVPKPFKITEELLRKDSVKPYTCDNIQLTTLSMTCFIPLVFLTV